ncbi:Phenol hydroxylase P5 protein [Novipirellula aureliae]|uniref:Phenol hydroxylase P5 protein n=1 Tax=Novipirellula aureliae TaxID=2527966 RepID=A0A5C6DYV6_9BACT|nr:FAD-dependent oxidoreductase [Novipirellula aureliae]TWU40089.1 Phenol hydroxylase P5 protein [Novipirellula aureliae]
MLTNIQLIKKHVIAKDTMAFHFSKPEGFDFRAGQFADFTLLDPPETDDEGNTRCFSLVDAPYEPDLVIATRMRDSAFKRVLRELPLGTEIKMDGAYGDFTLHKTESTPAVFMIGGIGVTPVRSMIAQATHDKTTHQITLLHSSSTPDELPFVDDFEQLTKDNQKFRYVAVASDSAPDDWRGERGRIDAEMVKKYVSDRDRPIYYLSGPPSMVKAMRQLLVGMKVNEDNIRSEEFSGY